MVNFILYLNYLTYLLTYLSDIMLWDEITTISKKQLIDPKQVLREELQKTILTFFSQKGYFSTIVFQGGTALRLCYGNPRFSEDLDFVFKNVENTINISVSSIKRFILDSYPFLETINIKNQKTSAYINRYVLTTRGNVTSQNSRIHIEFASVPSYDNQPIILSYPPYNPAIQVETKEEILADKLTALGCRSYVKGRDLWDIYFLSQEQKVTIEWDYVRKKISDYGVSRKDYLDQLRKRRNELEQTGQSLLSFELKRFLSQPLYTQYEKEFSRIIEKVISQMPSESNL